jgi:hypothetical protein
VSLQEELVGTNAQLEVKKVLRVITFLFPSQGAVAMLVAPTTFNSCSMEFSGLSLTLSGVSILLDQRPCASSVLLRI